jgi:UDP-N-acetylmuramoylalanine--D-glutamate ligase
MKLEALARGKTLLLGFGREGRSLERALLERHPDADVAVLCDSAPEPAPRRWPNLAGADEALDWRPDRILRSPGVPLRHPAVADGLERGIPVTCTTSCWFAERPDARVIGVTGSKGKSTTAALIAHLLSAAGRRVRLGGNIGVAALDWLDDTADWFVVELSSYQLADLQGRIEIGVFTRLFPEHQDWHGSVERYYRDKLRLIELLGDGPLWFNARDRELGRRLREWPCPSLRAINASASDYRAGAEGVHRRGARVLRAGDFPLSGRHNLDNAALALAVVESIAGWRATRVEALSAFRPLPHRLERLDVPGEIEWIDDSISTTPYATLAALQACRTSPVLIAGGLERGADWSEVAEYCRSRPLEALVALPDNGASIAERLASAGAVRERRISRVQSMEEAVAEARCWLGDRGAVLLSPGAPSFPRFRDFQDRGERFADAVRGNPSR